MVNEVHERSLRDVAEATGYSIRTVGRALKGNGYVNPSTKEQIRAAAEKLGYQPNLTARALKMGRNDVIAAVLGSMDELHIAKLKAFEQAVREGGYSLMTVFLDEQTSNETALPEFLVQRRPAGIAVFPGVGRERRAAIHAQAARLHAHSVFIDAEYDEALDSIWIDRPRGVRDAIRHLAEKGRQRIAYLGPDDPSRLDGYLATMTELGREAIHIRQYDERRGDVTALLDLDPRPDAVQVYSDVLAMRLLAALQQRGIRVPDDMAVVSFDNRDFASLANPPLTTVAQPNHEVGEAAARMLLDKIGGMAEPANGWSRSIATTLVKRQSG